MDLVTDKLLDDFRSAASAARASGKLAAFLGEIERAVPSAEVSR